MSDFTIEKLMQFNNEDLGGSSLLLLLVGFNLNTFRGCGCLYNETKRIETMWILFQPVKFNSNRALLFSHSPLTYRHACYLLGCCCYLLDIFLHENHCNSGDDDDSCELSNSSEHFFDRVNIHSISNQDI